MSESTQSRRVTLKEASRVTGVPFDTLRRWVAQDRLTHVRRVHGPGRAWLVDLAEVIELGKQRPLGQLRLFTQSVGDDGRSLPAVSGAPGDVAAMGARRRLDETRPAAPPAVGVRAGASKLRPKTQGAQSLTLTSTERRMALTQESCPPCAYRGPAGSRCRKAPIASCPVPLCVVHLAHVVEFVNQNVSAFMGSVELRSATLALQEVARASCPGVVYYLRVGDLIKIGHTRRIDQRLKAYPPDAVLLATEPGTEELETQRHDQFAEFLGARCEWFRPGLALLAHIEALT